MAPFFGQLLFDYDEWKPSKPAGDTLEFLQKRTPAFLEYKRVIEANRKGSAR